MITVRVYLPARTIRRRFANVSAAMPFIRRWQPAALVMLDFRGTRR